MTAGTPPRRRDDAFGSATSRRRFLAALGSVGVGVTAGCIAYDRPSHDGRWPPDPNAYVTDRPGPGPDAYVAWSRGMRDSDVSTTPVVADGTVYHLDSKVARGDPVGGTWLSAHDAATGETTWETRLWQTSELYYLYHQGPPVLDGDRLFAQIHGGVVAVSVDGERLWTFENAGPGQPRPDSAPPVVADGTVVAGTYDSRPSEPERLYGVDRETGEEAWTREFDGDGVLWRLALNRDTCYAPLFPDGPLYAVDVATGEILREYDIAPQWVVTPTKNRLVVPAADADGEFVAVLDTGSGETLWQRRERFWGESAVATADDRLYYADSEGVVARQLDTGERLWRFGDGWRRTSPNTTPVLAGEYLYAVGARTHREKGEERCVFVLDAETGEEVGRIAPWSAPGPYLATPAVVEGTMYLAHDGSSSGSKLLCLEDCAAGAFGRCLLG